MWVLLAFASGVFYTLVALLNKRIFKEGRDPWIFTFFFSGIIALASLPLMVINYKAPAFSTYLPWLVIVAASGFVSLHNYLNFTALKHLSASVHGTFYKLRLVWAFLIAVALGQDSWALFTVLGIVATVTAGAVLLWQRDGKISAYGVFLVLASSVVNAGTLVLFKYLFIYFGVETLIFITALLPVLILLFVTPHVGQRLSLFLKKPMGIVVMACLFAVGANFAILFAIQLGQVAGVLVIVEAFLILVLAGEHFVLKDTAGVERKIVAVLLATIGAVCILLV